MIMINKKFTIISISVFAALSSINVSANQSDISGFNYYGYARSGISTTSDGGEQMCFGSGADGHYVGRLGDECDTYIETGFGKTFNDGANKNIDVNTTLSYQTSPGAQFNDYQSVTEPGLNSSKGDVAIREINVVGEGYFDSAPEASIWAGKRFYKRKSIDLLDLYYLNNSGYGAGVENINVGNGALSIAVIASDQSAYTGKPNANGQKMVQVNKIDARFDNMKISDGYDISLAVIYGLTDKTKVQDEANEPQDTGYFTTAELDYKVGDGKHAVAFQYAKDAMGEAAWRNASGSKVDTYATWDGTLDKSMRIIAYGSAPWSDALGGDYSVVYENGKTIADVNVAETNPSRFSLVMAPYYRWNEKFLSRLEFGYTDAKESYSTKSVDLYKIMLAQEFAPKISASIDPKIKLYAGSFWGAQADNSILADGNGENGNVRLGVQMTASWW